MINTDIIILAAGKGTRMKSSLPKVLHPLAGKSLLGHVMATAETVENAEITVVTGHGAEAVENMFANTAHKFVQQTEQLGTAHAVATALPCLRDDARVLVLYGDVPLIKPETISKMLTAVTDKSIGLLTVTLDNPTGYGRILRDNNGQVEAIVEQKDAQPEQLTINEVNTGVISLTTALLQQWLPKIDNKNAQKEYYLTDLIAIARDAGYAIEAIQPESVAEVEGVNNRQQLAALERELQKQQAQQLMMSGTTLADPSRFDQRGVITAGTDNFIDINCLFIGHVTLGSGVTIGPNCTIIDSVIGDGVEIKANSILEQTTVAANAVIGPFARLRPGTELGEGSKVGNFVETKKALVGKGSKINHLSYVGDAELGKDVNVGAGTITCNYDGVNKHKTEIGDGAFIGSNSSLVAPVVIGEGATVGAGSTVSKSAPEDQLTLTRAKQRSFPDWKRPEKK